MKTDDQYIKSIWVIGASSGIGQALVSELDQPNCQIFVSARQLENIEHLFNDTQARIIPVALDMSDEQSVKRIW